MKQILESFCTACEWHGNGEGLTGCPICGEPITALDLSSENVVNDPEEYPEDALKKTEEEDEAFNY